ncbi:hypothetical protein ELUMI_v1c01110 [Williamsoniiplasma luminosum]|uniref:ABC-2 type transporter domain-containing protein n=1 Tax=Williamsoniiplasma luminosum TaxID=214888 RepID=A0A2K8NSR5_9MOLU|nr:ABC transporter permease [Williamsoniiplasma luminosum]ATZ16839.1 hypothetical protein ELUMI_v1c01110 [Williamsoniiplasma luminosum]
MFKIELIRIIKTPINWIFSVILPIALMILFGLLLQKDFLNYGIMALVLLVSLTSTIIPISIYICSDKIEKRIKHYLIIKGAITKYTSALYFVNLIMFEFVAVILFLIALLGFKIQVDYKTILMLISFSFISYTLAFIIAIILGPLINSINAIIPYSMFIFYVLIFISGITVPLQTMMDQYFYIEVLTPFGCLYMFYSYVIAAISLSSTQLIITFISIVIWIIFLLYLFYVSLKMYRK